MLRLCVKTFSVLCIVLLFVCLTVTQIQADELVFQENFSNGLARWQPTRDDGSLWKVSNGKVDVTVSTRETITELVPKDEYWHESWQNIEYSLDLTPLVGVDRNISFNVQSNQNWYEVHFVDRFFNLVHVLNGQKPFDHFFPYVMENGHTYHIKIRFHTGLIQVFSNSILIAQQYDPSFQTYGKIGLKVTTGLVYPTRIQFDNLVVKRIESDGEFFSVPTYKQTDPRWAQVEYDSAQKWTSNPTINRWGCALVSMVMVLRHHGIVWLPDGQDLNPQTLNTWLRAQPDGYLQGGLLNWLAVTRLTQLVSKQRGTPKLEYNRTDFFDTSKLEQTFARHEPMILEMPGHFVVGRGLTGNKQEFWITDPYYDYPKTTTHPLPVLSARLFKPSQTDLSYILATVNSDVHIVLADETGSTIWEAQRYSEFIASDDGEQLPTIHVLTFAKPTTQRFKLFVLPNDNKPYEVHVYSYDQEGSVFHQTESGVVDYYGKTILIDFHKEGDNPASWTQVLHQLQQTYDQQSISQVIPFLKLERIIKYALPAAPSIQLRYTKLVLETLDHWQTYFSVESLATLRSLVIRLQADLIASLGNT